MTASRFVQLLLCSAIVSLSSCKEAEETPTQAVSGLDAKFDVGTLLIEADDGARHKFDVYLALDHEQKSRGLMFVRSLPERTGMLFVYDEIDTHSMWMKNTYISLDMVFARPDGTVSSVIHGTQPLSLASQSSIEPVKYVLELNAGVARRYNIGSKSRILWEPQDAVGQQ